MRRFTHAVMGVAAAMPLAVGLAPMGAVGALWLGLVGAAAPDYLDLRAQTKRILRHRGASHGFLSLWLCTAVVGGVLTVVQRAGLGLLALQFPLVQPWTFAFFLGFLSHQLGDACTVAGIQPWLPISSRRFWLLPRFLRGRSNGPINVLAIAAAASLIGVVLGLRLLGR